MIVLDASAALSALLHDGSARQRLGREAVHVPHLVDVEIADALRKQARRGNINSADAERALGVWGQLGVQRHPMVGLLARMWQLRANVSAYDAAYVALAEALGCTLMTADGRLARAPGPRCVIEVVPR